MSIIFFGYLISEWTRMSISELFRYRNDSFQSGIFSSNVGITDSMSDIANIKINVDAYLWWSFLTPRVIPPVLLELHMLSSPSIVAPVLSRPVSGQSFLQLQDWSAWWSSLVGTYSDIRDQRYRTELDIGTSDVGLKRAESYIILIWNKLLFNFFLYLPSEYLSISTVAER